MRKLKNMLNKDHKLRDLQTQADELFASIRKLEHLSSKPDKLPEYKDAIADHQKCPGNAKRKRSLRPQVERILRDSVEEKPPVENPLDIAKREVALCDAQK